MRAASGGDHGDRRAGLVVEAHRAGPFELAIQPLAVDNGAVRDGVEKGQAGKSRQRPIIGFFLHMAACQHFLFDRRAVRRGAPCHAGDERFGKSERFHYQRFAAQRG